MAVSLVWSSALAQTWEAIDDPESLSALFSDTVIEATLAGGIKTVGRYYSDGTGVVETLGETFPRTWEIRDNDQVCIGMGGKITCFRVERNTETTNEYRAQNLTTGETFVMSLTVGPDEITVDSPTTSAGGAAKPSANEFAKKLANPNTPLASLTFKLQYRSFTGDLPDADDQDSMTLLFQPTFPFKLDNGDNVFFRPAIPYRFDQPVVDVNTGGFKSEAGFGDISFDLAYGGTTKGGFLWAGGIVSTVPTATDDDLGADRFTLGPELLIGLITESYVLGAFPNHQWDVAGSGDADINLTSVQLFGTYLPGDGWNVGTTPIITYDHEIDEATVPLNITAGRTIFLGGRPWKISVEVNYYVEQPDAFGPEWMIGFNIAPVVENIFATWFE